MAVDMPVEKKIGESPLFCLQRPPKRSKFGPGSSAAHLAADRSERRSRWGRCGAVMGRHAFEHVVTTRNRVIAVFRLVGAGECAVNEKALAVCSFALPLQEAGAAIAHPFEDGP